MTNAFGGKNPNGLYVPMSEDEQEVLHRLAQEDAYVLNIVGWGYVQHPMIRIGDKRIQFTFTLNFNRPEFPQPNPYFDVEVWAKGHKMFAKRMPTMVGGKPIEIAAGVSLTLQLDVAIHQISPELLKEIKPGLTGLTSRHGNMKLDPKLNRLYQKVLQSEAQIRAEDQKALETNKAIQEHARKVILPANSSAPPKAD